MPPHGPVGLGGSQIPFVIQVKRQHGLELEGILRWTMGGGVREGNWVLRNKAYQQPWNSSVDGAQRRACLPGALASAPGGGRRKDEGRSDTDQEPGFLSVRPRQNRDIENCLRLPPRELGTVTKAKVGRINYVIGSSEFGGILGISGRMIA